MKDKRKGNGGHSTKSKKEIDLRTLTKAEEEKANLIFVEAIQEFYNKETSLDAKKTFIKKTLMESQRGQLFIAEHIFGKAPQEIKQTNLNIDAKDLTEEEIKKINDVLEDAY